MRHNVRFWPKADIQGALSQCPLRTQSGPSQNLLRQWSGPRSAFMATVLGVAGSRPRAPKRHQDMSRPALRLKCRGSGLRDVGRVVARRQRVAV